MSFFGSDKSSPAPGIGDPSRQYVDLGSEPLSHVAQRGRFDKETEEFRTQLDSITTIPKSREEYIERAAKENGLLHEALQTAANHYLFLDFFEKLRENLIPSDEELFHFGESPPYRPPVYGPENAFRAQAQHLRILALDSEDQNQRCFPVWIVGRQTAEERPKKQSSTTQYLAIGLDHHLPSSVTNYTEHHEGYGSYFHRIHSKGGFLKKATDGMWNSAYGVDQPELSTAVSTASRAAYHEGFGLIEFTGPTELEPIRLTEEDTDNLRSKERDEYDIRPLALTYIADHHSVNFVTDMQPARIDDSAIATFRVLHHLTQIAETYGLMDELTQTAVDSRKAKQQADERTERALRQIARNL